MGRARSGTWRKSGQGFLVMVTIPASMFPPGKLPPPTIDPKTKNRRRIPDVLAFPFPLLQKDERRRKTS